MTDTVRQNATSTSEFAAPLPAGKYLVGDPCYSFTNDSGRTNGDDLWMEWLDTAWKDVDANRVRILEGEIRGFRIAASGTAFGDGHYDDQDGHGYPVDAGLIGAVPLEAIRVLYPEYAGLAGEAVAEKTSTRLVEFDRPFHVSYEEDGTVDVGGVRVMTGDEEDAGCSECGGYCDYDGQCLEPDEDEDEEE
jgi:hypothetical protein